MLLIMVCDAAGPLQANHDEREHGNQEHDLGGESVTDGGWAAV